MKEQKIVQRMILWVICAAALAGCGMADGRTDPAAETAVSGLAGAKTEAVAETGSMAETGPAAGTGAVAEPEGSAAEPPEVVSEPDTVESPAKWSKCTVPVLPAAGRELTDFVAEGWELIDSVELDYNGDGITDYVGVQEATAAPADGTEDYFLHLRLLFAVASDGPGEYRLDFQDENLIRTREEGGVFGDPYLPLTVAGSSFTTHAFGGSAWKWSEEYTYTYRDGVWYLTQAEEEYGYGPYPTEYTKSDWESGIRTCRKRSDDFEDMQEHWGEHEALEDDGVYDIEYEMRLDEPITIYQAGKRWWLAPERVTDWEVGEIVLAEGIDLAPEAVGMPEKELFHYCDEECVLYAFSNKEPDKEEWRYYLAMYRWQDRSLIVLAEGDGTGSCVEEIGMYGGKIYYSTEVRAHIAYKSVQEGKAEIEEGDCTIGMRLNRVNADGTGRETVFEYLYPGTDQPVLEERPPYMGLIVEMSGGEAVVKVYIGNGQPHPVYRMNVDGSGLQQIGQIPNK